MPISDDQRVAQLERDVLELQRRLDALTQRAAPRRVAAIALCHAEAMK